MSSLVVDYNRSTTVLSQSTQDEYETTPIQDEQGTTPLSIAYECGHLEVATVFVHNRADVDYVETIIMSSIYSTSCVRSFLTIPPLLYL